MKPFVVPEMTLKVDQGHWRWHFVSVVCSNHVSISYRFCDIQRRIMSCAGKLS